MYIINKIRADHVIDFAAEELKKYLRMMMPRCGEIAINLAPDATDGYRLGLMSDFGLDTSEAEDIALDDILHIDTDENGGIIAGSNARSVLLAVYRFLTINGCRWLYPGVDGEYIPMKAVEAVKYHKMADCRYRAQCNEGCPSQQSTLDSIDYMAKIGMNAFSIEFFNPQPYYSRYYNHKNNQKHREPEPVSDDTVLQWKRATEVEISKRGLQFHDIGHGWTTEAFGLTTEEGWSKTTKKAPEEIRQYLAMVNGVRDIYDGVIVMTQYCMSNPDARRKIVDCVCDYAEMQHADDHVIHFALADAFNCHCECEECQKMTASDWLVLNLNEIDEELTRRKLNTRISFGCYFDATWAPEKLRFNNPSRFLLDIAPGGRSYTKSVPVEYVQPKELTKYVRNKNKLPSEISDFILYGREWAERCNITSSYAFEYHYCLEEWYDLGMMYITKTMYDDVQRYYVNGIKGVMEDATQRNHFPNGFSYYAYAQTLFDTSLTLEEIAEDYYSHAYGEDWKKLYDFQQKISDTVDFAFMKGERSVDESRGKYYNPEIAKKLREVEFMVEEIRPFIEAHKNMPMRVQTVSYRLFNRYLEYVDGMSKVMVLKALGGDREAHRAFWSFVEEFGKYEIEMERYFDFGMAIMLLCRIFGKKDNLPF